MKPRERDSQFFFLSLGGLSLLKSLMDNPSLHVSGQGGSTNRTFTVENFAENEYGQWATDEATGEQVHIDDGRSCFWTWDDNEHAWQSSQFKSREAKRRKGKGKRKGKGGLKRTGKAHLAKNKHRTLNGGRKKIVFGGPRVKKSRKGSSKSNEGSQKGGFRTYQPEKGIVNEFNPHKGRGKDQKRKGKEGAYPQSGLSTSETPGEEGYGHVWVSDDWSSSYWPDDSSTSAAGWSCTRAHTAWMASAPLNLANHPTHVVLDLGCTRPIVSRAAITQHRVGLVEFPVEVLPRRSVRPLCVAPPYTPDANGNVALRRYLCWYRSI